MAGGRKHRRLIEEKARSLAKAVLADPAMRERVAANPKMRSEVLARARWITQHDKMTEANRILIESMQGQIRWIHRRPLFAYRYSQIVDRASQQISMLRAHQAWAMESGRPDPTFPEPPCAARSLSHALEIYCMRRKPTARGFDRWLWKKCWMYQDERRECLAAVEPILKAKRAFPHVDVNWMCFVRADSLVLEKGVDREMIQQFFWGEWE